jgi:hypothetical protein
MRPLPSRLLIVAVAAAALSAWPASAEQDGPMRKPGSFTAKAEGAVAASIKGDATIFVRKAGGTHLYLLTNSDQMMALKVMISVEIVWPTHSSVTKYQIPDGTLKSRTTALVQWERLDTRERHTTIATGSIDIDVKDPMSGRFELTAKDGTETLKLTGTFKDAPVMLGIN